MPLERMASNPSKAQGWSAGVAVLVVILLVVICFGIWGTCTDSGKSTFANIKSKIGGGGGGSLKSLDVIMFMSPTCPWCKKMMAVLDAEGQLNNVTLVDTSKPEGAAMAQQFGADKRPVPSFISRQLKTGTIGYRDSVAKLVEALKPPVGDQGQGQGQGQGQAPASSEEPGMPEGQIDIRSLQIVMFAQEGCGYCTQAKEALSQAGVMDAIQIVDINTPEGKQMAGQMLPPGTSGVPSWFSVKSGKHVVGYRSLDHVIQSLQ